MNHLSWTKQPDGSYHATAYGLFYTILLEPRPTDRYVVFADGEAQHVVAGDKAGQRLLFWYLRDAKEHCHDVANGGAGFTQNTEKQHQFMKARLSENSPQTVVPYPTKDQVIAAVRTVTRTDGRVWPIVDDARVALADHEMAPGTIERLRTYVLEIAKWGRIRRWLTDTDIQSAALALWDVRQEVNALRGHGCFQDGTAVEVTRTYEMLLARMLERGVIKAHYSWASKILHWLLPACAPVYDSLVLQELRIGITGPQAYRQIIAWEYNCAKVLQPFTEEVLNGIREMTLLAAIDNYLWWAGKHKA